MSKLLYQPYYAKFRPPLMLSRTVANETINSMAWGPGYGLAVGNNGCIKRSDSTGLIWTVVQVPAVASASTLNKVIWTGTYWLVVGGGPSLASLVLKSTDAVTWTVLSGPVAPAGHVFTGIAVGRGYTIVYAGGSYEYWISFDQVNWFRNTHGGGFLGQGVQFCGNSFTFYGSTLVGYLNGNPVWTMGIYKLSINSGNLAACTLTQLGDGRWCGFSSPNCAFTNSGRTVILIGNVACITLDGGDSYLFQNFAPTYNNVGVSLSWAASIGWLALSSSASGYTGTTPLTSPDGFTWTAYDTSSYGDQYTAAMTDGTNTIAASGSSYFSRTSDGLSWESDSTMYPVTTFRGPSVVGGQLTSSRFGLHVYGSNGTHQGSIYSTTNNGATWYSNQFYQSVVPALAKIWDCGTRLSVVGTGWIAYTTDGKHWTNTTFAASSYFASSFQPICMAASPTVTVVGGNSGKIDYTSSSTYATWAHATTSVLGSGTVNWITWNGSQFLASLSTGVVGTSTDGATWVARTLSANSGYVGSNLHIWTGSKYLVCVNGTQVVTSPDGITWITQTYSASAVAPFTSMAVNGSTVIACNGTPLGYISNDGGTTWASYSFQTPMPVVSVAYSAGTWYATSNLAGFQYLAYSTDGINWLTKPTFQPALKFLKAAANGTTLFSSSTTKFLQSVDGGATWSYTYIANPSTSGITLDFVVQGAGKYVAKTQSSGTPTMWYSTDGKTWTQGQSIDGWYKPTPTTWTTPAYSTLDYDGTTFITGAGYGKSGVTCVWKSTDGMTWPATNALASGGSSIAKYTGRPNTWVVNSYMSTSPNYTPYLSVDGGVTWAQMSLSNVGSIQDIQYGASHFVLLSPTALLVSSDGTTWASKTTTYGANANFTNVAYANGMFLITGAGIACYSKDDGLSWAKANTYTSSGSPMLTSVWDGTAFRVGYSNGDIHYLVPTT